MTGYRTIISLLAWALVRLAQDKGWLPDGTEAETLAAELGGLLDDAALAAAGIFAALKGRRIEKAINGHGRRRY